jgi:hypothetical protein
MLAVEKDNRKLTVDRWKEIPMVGLPAALSFGEMTRRTRKAVAAPTPTAGFPS